MITAAAVENEVKICYLATYSPRLYSGATRAKMGELYAKRAAYFRGWPGEAIEKIGPRNFIADGSINRPH